MCVYVCVCVCLCTRVCVCLCVFIYIYIYIYILYEKVLVTEKKNCCILAKRKKINKERYNAVNVT